MGTSIIFGIFWGIVGIAYFRYGKKQQNIVALISGIGLMVFPYFISSLFPIVFIGFALVVIPFFIKY
jgi:hypothetical protein